MDEILSRVIEELRGVWRFRWAGLAAAWAVCVIGWVVVTSMPDTYESNARVYVDTRSALRPLLQGLTINPDVASDLDLVKQVMLSRPHLEKVARATDLDAGVQTPQDRDNLIQSLQTRIVLEAADARSRSSVGEGLYRITFRDHSRQKSLEVVRTLLNSFVEDTLGTKRAGSETAQRFLEEQIKEHEDRLSEAENRLSEFKKKNVGRMPDQRGDYFARLQQEQAGLDQAHSALAVADSRRQEIGRQLAGEEPYLFGLDSGNGAAAAEGSARSGDVTYRIQDLERKLDELLLRYTEKHPEVIATRATLDELRKRQAEELERVRGRQQLTGSMSSSLKQNPVYQNLQLAQKSAEVQAAELRQDVAQRQAKVAELKSLVNTVPEVEAELSRLNRDYEVVHKEYLELVQRRQTASLTDEADRTGTVKFNVIDPPMASISPVAPNRPMLLSGVLLAGIAVGFAVAYLLEQLKPVFRTARTLAEITGRPVYGAVRRIGVARDSAAIRLDTLKFSGLAAALMLLYFAVLVLHETGVRFAHRLVS